MITMDVTVTFTLDMEREFYAETSERSNERKPLSDHDIVELEKDFLSTDKDYLIRTLEELDEREITVKVKKR